MEDVARLEVSLLVHHGDIAPVLPVDPRVLEFSCKRISLGKLGQCCTVHIVMNDRDALLVDGQSKYTLDVQA